MDISLKNRLYLFLFPLILFVLVGCCDDHFKVDRSVRIIDQGALTPHRACFYHLGDQFSYLLMHQCLKLRYCLR